MKKTLIALIAVLAASTAFAQHRNFHHGPRAYYRPYTHYVHRYDWVAPAIVFGAVSYELSRPVVPPYAVQPVCTETTTYAPPPGYYYRYAYDQFTGCLRGYLVSY
jgi:hypothetical protein